MYEIVCLLDILDYLKYIHIKFYMKVLIFFSLDVGLILSEIVFGYLSILFYSIP